MHYETLHLVEIMAGPLSAVSENENENGMVASACDDTKFFCRFLPRKGSWNDSDELKEDPLVTQKRIECTRSKIRRGLGGHTFRTTSLAADGMMSMRAFVDSVVDFPQNYSRNGGQPTRLSLL